jgi:hypothetical protein
MTDDVLDELSERQGFLTHRTGIPFAIGGTLTVVVFHQLVQNFTHVCLIEN